MSVIANYVNCIAFDNNKNILLIKKKRPDWQDGYFNGLGGKIEFAESTREAMSRKFQEESDINVHKHNWIYVCDMVNSNTDSSKVTFFTIKLDELNYNSKTDEKLFIVNYYYLNNYKLLPNLKALIELSLLRLNFNGTKHCGSITF
jgi:ADP-ribose pyrophosphatase YjhB (NUDIX family)